MKRKLPELKDGHLLEPWNSCDAWVRECPHCRSRRRSAKRQCGSGETGEGSEQTPLRFGCPQELKWCFSSENCFPALSRPNTTSKPGEVDHPKPEQAAHAVLLCHGLLTLPSPSKGKGCAAEPKHWSRDERTWSLRIFVLSFYTPFCFAFLWLVQSCLVQFFTVSLGHKRSGNSKQPEEIFPVVLHTLQCTGIAKWSLGAKTGEK